MPSDSTDLISLVGRVSVRHSALSNGIGSNLTSTPFLYKCEKVKRQFLNMLGNVSFVLICIFKPFIFSNHRFLFPTLKITTEAASSLGNTFNLFNE